MNGRPFQKAPARTTDATARSPAIRLGVVTLNPAIDKRYVLTHFSEGEVNRVSECAYSAGGKGLNVARVALLTGAEVITTGFLGGHAGAYVAEQLTVLGAVDAFVRVAGETRSCANIMNAATGDTTEILEPGPRAGAADVSRFLSQVQALLENLDVLVASGSLPRGCPVDVYATVVVLARDAGVPVVVDTSGAALEAAIAAGPSLIKPNLAEASALTGSAVCDENGVLQTADLLRDRGAQSVLLSRGADGAVLVTADGAWDARPPQVRALNAVGCGDAMVAAAALRLAAGDGPAVVLHNAVAVATAAAMSVETGSYRQEDLAAVLRADVEVRRLR